MLPLNQEEIDYYFNQIQMNILSDIEKNYTNQEEIYNELKKFILSDIKTKYEYINKINNEK